MTRISQADAATGKSRGYVPWGSLTTRRTRLPEADSAAPRFRAVVVLPTPPLLIGDRNSFIQHIQILLIIFYICGSG